MAVGQGGVVARVLRMANVLSHIVGYKDAFGGCAVHYKIVESTQMWQMPLWRIAPAHVVAQKAFEGIVAVEECQRFAAGGAHELLVEFVWFAGCCVAVVAELACYNKNTGRRIKACVPMHTFGHPVRIEEIAAICKEWHIELVEDAAESIGSTYKGKHTGTFGKIGAISFNGNKTITT